MSETVERFLDPDLQKILADGEKLLASAGGVVPAGRQRFNDYSFIVFPFAKVYEGFLKKLFFQIGAIDEFQFKNDRWRVGRALNPQLEKDLRHDESVYDRIANLCGGTTLPDDLWQAWKRGRNQLFHFFPAEYKALTFPEAKDIILEIRIVMEKALEACKIGSRD